MDEHALGALRFAERVSPAGSRNLIAPHESYFDVLQDVVRPARDILDAQNLKGFHELRAAYACERYEQITQHPAPIGGGKCCQVDRHLDREARTQISYELGHGRIDVVALEGRHEQTIRYGVVLGWSADRVALDTATPFTAGETYPS